MRYLLFLFCVAAACPAFAQPTADGKVYQFVAGMPDQMPVPPFDLNTYLSEHIHYPDSARKNKIEGRVVVQFKIAVDGYATDIKILKSVGYGLDEEAIRVLSSMPPWTPGRKDGKPTPVNYTLPISFKL